MIDLARYLVGICSGRHRDLQAGREVDDAVESVVAFDNGAVGTIEATRFATGRKNAFRWEINGSKGSIAFDLERLNELQVHIAGSAPAEQAQGFRSVLVSEADHPFGSTGGRTATSFAGSTASCTSCITGSRRSATTRRPARRDVRGRPPPRRGATPSCAPRRAAAVRRSAWPPD